MFKPLNPPFEEYISDDSTYNKKKSRIDYYIVDGFNERDSSFDGKIDSVVIQLGNTYKNIYSIYSIYFYKLGGNIKYNTKYNLHDLRMYVDKTQCTGMAVFREGSLSYFVYVEDEKILYDYVNKRAIDEIYE
ncbi:hypothetical protein [Emticicia sp. SJ17W-69]|uniref:hypothetical protein n=1 Tax=Emticicia sp. SJ17W-69 TaxID=3421657 RepID=UPI003EC04562